MLLWEVFSYGIQPWEDIDTVDQLLDVITREETLSKPKRCPNDVYALMLKVIFSFSVFAVIFISYLLNLLMINNSVGNMNRLIDLNLFKFVMTKNIFLVLISNHKTTN